jgi:hypothetical protein
MVPTLTASRSAMLSVASLAAVSTVLSRVALSKKFHDGKVYENGRMVNAENLDAFTHAVTSSSCAER